MMQIFKNPNINFIKYRRICALLSSLIILSGLIFYVQRGGFNYGIDFAGGTQLTLKFAEKPDINRLRAIMTDLNLGDVVIQEFDEPGLNEIMIRIENTGKEGDVAGDVLSALRSQLSPGIGEKDINFMGKEALSQTLMRYMPDRSGEVEQIVESIAQYKKDHGIIRTMEDLPAEVKENPEIMNLFTTHFSAGSFSLMGAENVGPKVGRDLRAKAQQAIIWSLLGMLVYIWIRFRHFAYGLGAIAALFHDVLVTLSFFVFTNREISLTVVAAILTLVGYSVNDTVVVFDRIRENLRKIRRKDFTGLVNRSVNETLSRTVITSGTTFLTVMALYLLGGDVIRNFSFALVIGVIVGTYSSIFIASPVVIFMHGLAEKRKVAKRR